MQPVVEFILLWQKYSIFPSLHFKLLSDIPGYYFLAPSVPHIIKCHAIQLLELLLPLSEAHWHSGAFSALRDEFIPHKY